MVTEMLDQHLSYRVTQKSLAVAVYLYVLVSLDIAPIKHDFIMEEVFLLEFVFRNSNT